MCDKNLKYGICCLIAVACVVVIAIFADLPNRTHHGSLSNSKDNETMSELESSLPSQLEYNETTTSEQIHKDRVKWGWIIAGSIVLICSLLFCVISACIKKRSGNRVREMPVSQDSVTNPQPENPTEEIEVTSGTEETPLESEPAVVAGPLAPAYDQNTIDGLVRRSIEHLEQSDLNLPENHPNVPVSETSL